MTLQHYEVTYGTQRYVCQATDAKAAIRGICKQMNVGGRYNIRQWRTYMNEAGNEETQAYVKGKFVRFTIYAEVIKVHQFV